MAAACGVLSPEEQLLTRDFEASRLHDTTMVASMSSVTFNPRTEGVVDEFAIDDVEDLGETKHLTVHAIVRPPEGGFAPRRLQVTLQRRDDRWFITGVRDAP